MANTGGGSSWDKIQLGVKDTERLIGKREYNLAMVKARQTLEFMVKLQAERAGLSDGDDLMALIDTLHQNRWISKTTCEHYHKIRMIGNKAAHEGDHNAYNANQAYHMLSQEVYTFANNYRNAQKGTRRPSNTSSSTRSRRKRKKQPALNFYFLLKLLIPILCVVLLLLVIRLIKPADGSTKPTSAPETTESIAPTQSQPETTPEETDPVYKTTTELNVRSAPNQENDRIGLLPSGTTVDYVRAHDDQWAVILYEGKEAYVASQYLKSE